MLKLSQPFSEIVSIQGFFVNENQNLALPQFLLLWAE
jgi:hypothetical protein